MALAPEDLPSSSLPAESPQFGEGTQMAAQRKAMESRGTARPAQAQNPQQGAVGSPTPGGAPPAPVQPPPRQPLTPADMRPGGPVFMQPRMAPAPSWRQQLRLWAAHPDANLIRRLSQRADAGLPKRPGADQQQ